MSANAFYPRAVVILDVLFEDFADGSGEDKASVTAIPRSVEIRRNDHRMADQFRVELDYKDMPFDPRTLRSVHVRILLGDVGEPDGVLSIDEERYQAFVGFLDVPSVKLEEDGDVVTLEGRDYTGTMLDAKWSGAAIDVSRPLSQVVDEITATIPALDALTTVYANGTDSVTLSDAIGRTKFACHEGDDTWTVLCDLCGRAGLIPVFVLNELRFLDASARQAERSATFLYGENLKSLSYRRNFREARESQVEVRCWDETTRTSRVVRYPAQPVVTAKKMSQSGKVKTTTAPVIPYFVAGTFTEQALSDLAERIWEEAARRQIEGSLETKEMMDLDGATDLPLLANGDKVVLTLGTALLTGIAGMSQAEAVSFLTGGSNAMDPATAQAVVSTFAQAENLAKSFFVREATHRWTREDGYSVQIDFINYLDGA